MTLPLMPKATAVWLVDNTSLTFEQIGEFTGMHPLEVQGIADGEVATSMIGVDPVAAGQLEQSEIERCEQDSKARLKLSGKAEIFAKQKHKGARYTPISKRGDKPDAIAWLIKHYPTMPDSQIVKIVGTTKKTIDAVRNRSHWNSGNIKPRDPVLLGLCTQTHLDQATKQYKPAESDALAS